MNWQSAALALAGVIGGLTAVIHGILIQRLVVRPVEATFLAEPRTPKAIRRLVPLLMQFSTFAWLLGALALGRLLVKQNRGFTLIELLVTLGVSAILLVIAVPNLIQWHQRSVSQDLASRFADDINWSRQTAMSSAQPVTFTLAADCTWAVNTGSVDIGHSLTETQKSQNFAAAQCSSTPTTLQFGPDGLVTGTAQLTTPTQALQVLASGTVLAQFKG